MRVLVTGGAGFVGSHVVDLLLAAGHSVTAVDDVTTGRAENVATAAQMVKLDITGPLDGVFAEIRPDVVIHLAAQVSVPNSVADPARDLAVNIGGTVSVAAAAARAGARKIVSVSSAAVYGIPGQLPLTEDSPVSPLSPYGLSKLTAESYLRLLHDLLGIDYTIIRPSNIYGPRQTTEGEGAVVPAFLNRFCAGQDPLIQGDGEQTRDFIYVSDMADAIIKAMDRASGETLNVSSNTTITVNQLWRMVADAIGWQRPPVHGSPRPGDIRHSVLDNARAQRSLAWEPRVPFAEGLQQTVAWFREAKARGLV